MLILLESHFYINELLGVFAITDIRHEEYCNETAYTYNSVQSYHIPCIQWSF
jgi:hypothetical protein